MGSSVPVDNQKKDIILGKGPAPGLDDTTTAEYSKKEFN